MGWTLFQSTSVTTRMELDQWLISFVKSRDMNELITKEFTMTFHFTAKAFMAALAVVSTLELTGRLAAQTQPAPGSVVATTFPCTNRVRDYATIARKSELNMQTDPIIRWTRPMGGLTPEQRCIIVSGRLTQAVAANGGMLSNLRVKIGSLNGSPVLCYIKRQESCSSDNLIMTLFESDTKFDDKGIIANLKEFAKSGTGLVTIAGPQPPFSIGEEIDLGPGVEKAFETAPKPGMP